MLGSAAITGVRPPPGGRPPYNQQTLPCRELRKHLPVSCCPREAPCPPRLVTGAAGLAADPLLGVAAAVFPGFCIRGRGVCPVSGASLGQCRPERVSRREGRPWPFYLRFLGSWTLAASSRPKGKPFANARWGRSPRTAEGRPSFRGPNRPAHVNTWSHGCSSVTRGPEHPTATLLLKIKSVFFPQ